ncbi:MAG: protein BatD [Lentisphaerae bacterium]|nr:protein BatD [Lentisphaerota bacterium]
MKRPVHLMTLLTGALALVWLPAFSAAAMDVTFDVQPRLLNLGETAQASLTFHGTRSAPSVDFPDIPGLQITSTGQQMQFGAGGSRVTLTYTLFPRRAGAHVIGPYTLDLNGRQIQIPEIRLDVRAPDGNASERELVFARLQLPETPPYVHQVFDITLQLYSLPSIELTRDVNLLGGFPETGFAIGSFEELQMVREEVDGQIYHLRRFRARARALSSGTFTLQPALRVGIVDPNARPRRRDPFGGFFDDPFSRPSATPVTAAAPAAPLTVRPIPSAGRPLDFAGAVGLFDFSVDVRPRELKVGEPVTVSLRLQGAGNIAAARLPSFSDTDTFRAYEARLVGDSPDPAAERGAKTFEQVVIPRTENLTELPALRFSFFNPVSGTYETRTAGPFPLTVHPSENGAGSLMLQVPGANGGVGKSLVLGRDIIYLKSAPARWRNGSPSPAKTVFRILLYAAAPFALAGLWAATRRRNRLATDIALARRQKAPRRARANLRNAENALRESGAPAAVFTPLAAAVTDYFGNRLNLPPGAVAPSLLLDRFAAAGFPEDDLERWRNFFALTEQILYARPPALDRNELSTWIATVTTLLRKAERSKL